MSARGNRTIRWAVRGWSPAAKQAMIDLWDSCGTLDLYDGDLKIYLQVLKQKMESTQKEKDRLLEAIQKTKTSIQQLQDNYWK